jgi:hypothetical protein
MTGATFSSVRLVLLREWDPIGIRSMISYSEDTEDEYDSYAAELVRMINSGAKPNEIRDYLLWSEQHIGAGVSQRRIDRVTSSLLSLG